MIHRRQFLTAAAAAAASRLLAQTPNEWGSPVLDMHLHFRGNDGNYAHIEGSGCTMANLLTPANQDAGAQEAIAKHPGRYIRFSSAGYTQAGLDQMRQCVKAGALGLGELHPPYAVDSPEMRGIYELSAELKVPVTIHFEEDTSGKDCWPLSGLPAMLRAYPKTIVIGHANAFWANVSADVPEGVAYPTGKIKPGGLTDRMLSEFDNLHADMSANSGRNMLGRDPDFAAGFLARHQDKLMFGSDCPCRDGHGTGQVSKEPLIRDKCVARETLTALKQLASPEIFRKIVWTNSHRLLKLSA